MFPIHNLLLNQTKIFLPHGLFLAGQMSVPALRPGLVIADRTLIYYCFGVIVVVILAFVIGRRLKKKKPVPDQALVQQNEAANTELTKLLTERSTELEKSIEIIRKQNAEIALLKTMLKTDNDGAEKEVMQVGKTAALSGLEDFETFSKIYPDKDAVLKYIAGLKWSETYACNRCTNETYLAGQTPYSRRCTKCGYDESATVNTIFHNSKIQLNKALYMLILVYRTKGTISSYKLAELLDIRQSTCWVYSSRFKKKLLESKVDYEEIDGEGWSGMVVDAGG